MYSKVAVSIFVIALIACASAQSNHFEMGNKNPGDRQLHYEIVQKSSSLLSIVTKDITFPVPGTVNSAIITYIRAYDQYTNGDGGYCTLLSGGIGFTSTKLHFKSQRGHGFNFILEIWGY